MIYKRRRSFSCTRGLFQWSLSTLATYVYQTQIYIELYPQPLIVFVRSPGRRPYPSLAMCAVCALCLQCSASLYVCLLQCRSQSGHWGLWSASKAFEKTGLRKAHCLKSILVIILKGTALFDRHRGPMMPYPGHYYDRTPRIHPW
jgi:hypothetical protein